MLLLLSFDIKRYFRGRYISEALIDDLYVVSVCACAYKYVRVRLALHMRAVAPISSSSSNSMLYEPLQWTSQTTGKPTMDLGKQPT